ncbi:hypothetical protein Pelo_7268 [Pelomyxa schiedti]|nr:hypothetical protein Pelo_7268 [Pelomyxa schiedti]
MEQTLNTTPPLVRRQKLTLTSSMETGFLASTRRILKALGKYSSTASSKVVHIRKLQCREIHDVSRTDDQKEGHQESTSVREMKDENVFTVQMPLLVNILSI